MSQFKKNNSIQQELERMRSELRRYESEVKKFKMRLFEAQKKEAIALLARGIAHKINNNLTGIIGNLELLKINLATDIKAKKYIDSMYDAGRKMSELTRQLLAYAHEEETSQYKTPADLNVFIKETLHLIKHIIKSDINVVMNLGEDIPIVKTGFTENADGFYGINQ